MGLLIGFAILLGIGIIVKLCSSAWGITLIVLIVAAVVGFFVWCYIGDSVKYRLYALRKHWAAISGVCEETVRVQRANLWGVVDARTHNVLIPPQWDKISAFNNGLCLARSTDGFVHILNKQGRTLNQPVKARFFDGFTGDYAMLRISTHDLGPWEYEASGFTAKEADRALILLGEEDTCYASIRRDGKVFLYPYLTCDSTPTWEGDYCIERGSYTAEPVNIKGVMRAFGDGTIGRVGYIMSKHHTTNSHGYGVIARDGRVLVSFEWNRVSYRSGSLKNNDLRFNVYADDFCAIYDVATGNLIERRRFE